MMKRLLSGAAALSLIAVASCSAPASEKAGQSASFVRGDQSPAVDAVFAEYTDETPGCAVAIDHHKKIVHLAGYGMADLEQSVPIGGDSVFYAGSVSKQVVGMSAMLLAHDGEIDLDAAVSEYLPNLPAYADTITVRQVLHHTSGLRDFFVLFYLAGAPENYVITEDAIMAMLETQNGLNFEPGEKYAYSNSAYFLISQIAKATTGADLDVFAQERIFGPLAMKDSRFQHNHRRLVARKAHGYAPQDDGGFLLADSTLDVVGSGGMYTTVEDLIRWDRNFYDNKLGGGQALIDEMQTSGVLNSGEKTDYGVALSLEPYRGLRRVAHGGALVGYRAHLARFPDEEFTVALLCNSSEAKPGAYADAIADIYLADKLAPAEENTEDGDGEETAGDYAPASLAGYAGRYYSKEVANEVTISEGPEGLFVTGWAGADPALYPEKEDVFSHEGRYFKLDFRRDGTGEIIGFTANAARASGIIFDKVDEAAG